MRWPEHILRLFRAAVDITSKNGAAVDDVLCGVLDEVLRRAVWRLDSWSAVPQRPRLRDALAQPYTPMGDVTCNYVPTVCTRFSMDMAKWSKAITAFYEYAQANEDDLVAYFHAESKPYEQPSKPPAD